MEVKGNRHILKFFSGIQEIADTINKSYSYTQMRVNMTNGKDFTERDWKFINEHIASYRAAKNESLKDVKLGKVFEALQDYLDEVNK